ncbi:hypothetical protein JXR93_03400 [bacterium]|nr:hypothetical protein [bacterium]
MSWDDITEKTERKKIGKIGSGKIKMHHKLTFKVFFKDIITLFVIISIVYFGYKGVKTFMLYNQFVDYFGYASTTASKTINDDAVKTQIQHLCQLDEKIECDMKTVVIKRGFDKASVSIKFTIKVDILNKWRVPITFSPNSEMFF